jgi:hypothetical protein
LPALQAEAAVQNPPWQFVEQQSAPVEHAWPWTLHTPVEPGIAAQLPPAQLPVQQLPSAEHVTPTSRQRWSEHCPLSQRLVQQSVLLLQAPVEAPHSTTVFSHVSLAVHEP